MALQPILGATTSSASSRSTYLQPMVPGVLRKTNTSGSASKSRFLNKRELSKPYPNFPRSLRNGPALSFSFSNCGSVICTYHPGWYILSCLATSFTTGWNDTASPMMRSCPMWANLGVIRSKSMDSTLSVTGFAEGAKVAARGWNEIWR